MALLGAEVLLYPTAIGSEPPDPAWDSSGHWQRVMQGHAGANLMPLVAANRVGHEVGQTCDITFYGSSFIADNTGAKVAEAGRDGEAVIVATFDRDALRTQRAAWGLFRDRRPELYGPITTLDGRAADVRAPDGRT
jgi:N-carbamoylputrescine amidase